MGAHILGDFSSQKIALDRSYFEGRDCWVDCRVPGMVEIDAQANIGWCVNIVCMTHDTTPGFFGHTAGRPVKIGAHAFIAAFVTLYNCEIGEGAIVAVGSVVRSQNVAPWTMVEGNPARVIKRFNHETKKWEKV